MVDASEMLITVEQLESRLKWALSSDEKKVAEEAIWDASNLARFHGLASWSADACPPVVRSVVRNVCQRYMDLLESVVVSRAGDETEQYTDLRERTGTVFLTDEEIGTLRAAAGRDSSLVTMGSFVHSPRAPSSCCGGIRWVGWPGGDAFPYGGS